MRPIFLIPLLAAILSDGLPWRELSLTIEKDRYTSSDSVTLCRVRVVNHGWRTWPGRSLRFEARALEGGVVVASETGRFGLSLTPGGALETLIGIVGRYERFEVVPVPTGSSSSPGRRKRRAR